MALTHQIERQPGEQKIEKIIGAEMANPASPRGSISDNFRERRALFHVKHSASGSARHPLEPRRQPQQTDQTQNNKERPPTKARYQRPADKNAESRSQRLTGSDDGVGDAALALYEMACKYLRIGG